MFYSTGEVSGNFISADQLRVELVAGGLSKEQEEDIISHIQVDEAGDVRILITCTCIIFLLIIYICYLIASDSYILIFTVMSFECP